MPESLDLVPRRGRPRKFGAPARAVTLTLPEPVLAALGAIDDDLSRAVVRLAQPELAKKPHPPAELAPVGRPAGIVVKPIRTLEARTGILLVPLSDGRALISFDESISPAGLELTIQDALEDHRLPAEDARIFESIAGILRQARRAPDVSVRQHHIIVLESTRRRGSTRRRAKRPAAAAARRNL